ncbi:MAG: ParB N-terminal domain-containing protein [Cyanothece sp. SIO1E1]|nr:ParB N-terminal domain-containing protein [Cyanothece sp. SIO1E1]
MLQNVELRAKPMATGKKMPSLQVKKTANLSQFKKLKGNRPVNSLHVARLADSIQEYGMLVNPILVNRDMEIVDGQHRLEAAKKVNSAIYYIEVPDYALEQVHALNLNQKNWSQKQFVESYAEIGIQSYIDLLDFYENNKDFSLSNCVLMCSSSTTESENKAIKMNRGKIQKLNINTIESGNWKVNDLDKAYRHAKNIRKLKTYFPDGYNTRSFVGTMLSLFKNKKQFVFGEFMKKVEQQPAALVKSVNRTQYLSLIEDIYNYRRKEKVNLRF